MTHSASPLSTVLAVRVRASGRTLAALARAEPGTALLLAFMATIGAAYAWRKAQTETGALAVALAGLALLAMVHFTRRDERFLRLAGIAHRRLYAAEYALVALPWAAFLAASPHPRAALAMLAGPLLLPWLPADRIRALVARGDRPPPRVPVPAAAFEWAAGLRAAAPFVVILSLAAAALSRYPAALLAVLLLLAWTVAAFYVDGEDWAMVDVFTAPPARFLRRKTALALRLFAALAAPVAVLLLARHPALWPALLVGAAACLIVVAGAVWAKYALYAPGGRRPVISALTVLVLTLLLAVPPAALLLLWRLWRQAVRNLEALVAFD